MRATEFGLRSAEREQLIDLTPRIRELVQEQGWREGMLYVIVPHTTAGVCISENADPNVTADVLNALRRTVPQDGGYKKTEGNSDAHIKSALVGTHVVVPIVAGKLQLGRWQGVFVNEFDGPRDRIVRLYLLEG